MRRRATPTPLRRQRRQRHLHAGRVVAAALVAAAVGVTLLVTAFGSTSNARVRAATIAPAQRLLPARPIPQVIATRGALRLELPVAQSRVTALGYHASSSGALALDAIGSPANEGLLARVAHRLFGGSSGGLRYYRLGGSGGPDTGVLNVGASPGTDVYSPVDGTIVGIADNIVSGRKHGVRLDVQPADAPALVVSITHLRPDPAFHVGSTVESTVSKIGTVLDLSRVETQALARYTQDQGNHVAVEVHQATAPSTP
ncbi:MAG: hypothetical protein ACXWYS_08705 [Gaiellaceae bacterium]